MYLNQVVIEGTWTVDEGYNIFIVIEEEIKTGIVKEIKIPIIVPVSQWDVAKKLKTGDTAKITGYLDRWVNSNIVVIAEHLERI